MLSEIKDDLTKEVICITKTIDLSPYNCGIVYRRVCSNLGLTFDQEYHDILSMCNFLNENEVRNTFGNLSRLALNGLIDIEKTSVVISIISSELRLVIQDTEYTLELLRTTSRLYEKNYTQKILRVRSFTKSRQGIFIHKPTIEDDLILIEVKSKPRELSQEERKRLSRYYAGFTLSNPLELDKRARFVSGKRYELFEILPLLYILYKHYPYEISIHYITRMRQDGRIFFFLYTDSDHLMKKLPEYDPNFLDSSIAFKPLQVHSFEGKIKDIPFLEPKYLNIAQKDLRTLLRELGYEIEFLDLSYISLKRNGEEISWGVSQIDEMNVIDFIFDLLEKEGL